MMRDEPRKPAWLKIDLSSTDSYSHTSHTITAGGLHTICASGKCPNRGECSHLYDRRKLLHPALSLLRYRLYE